MTRIPSLLLLTLGALLAQPARAQSARAQADLYFPPASGEWEAVSPAQAGWSAERLDALLEWAGTRGSSDVVIALDGRILAERHFDLAEPSSDYANLRTGTTAGGRPIEDVASVQKSVLSFLTGVARAEDLLDLDDPVSQHLGPGWSKATPEQEGQITLRHLMSMTTGLSTGLEYEVAAGQRWQYNTRAYSRISDVLESVFGTTLDRLTQERLCRRIGMKDSRWLERGWVSADTDANRLGFSTTARDLARFGILVLAHGQWQGADVLADPSFLAEALASSQELNPSYGLLWWLNGKKSFIRGGTRQAGPLLPTAPADLVAGLGLLGRKLYVVPSLRLVVTRLGQAPGPDFDTELWRRLLEAAPQEPQSTSG